MSATCLLVYDIPDSAGIRNPSSRLRPIAVRINLSGWIIKKDDVPYALLNEMRLQGANWHVVEFPDNQAPVLLAMAREALRKEVEAVVASAKKTARKTEMAQLTADGEGDPKAYLRAVKAALRRADVKLDAYRTAARRFGVDGAEFGLNAAMRNVSCLRDSVEVKAAAYVRMIEQASEIPGLEGIADAASRDAVPAEILMDALEDAGVDVSPARTAFGQTDAPHPLDELTPLSVEAAAAAPDEAQEAATPPAYDEEWEPDANTIEEAVA